MEITTSEDLSTNPKEVLFMYHLPISIVSMKRTVCERGDIQYLNYFAMIFLIIMSHLEILNIFSNTFQIIMQKAHISLVYILIYSQKTNLFRQKS